MLDYNDICSKLIYLSHIKHMTWNKTLVFKVATRLTLAYFEYMPRSVLWLKGRQRLVLHIALCHNQGFRGYLSDEMWFKHITIVFIYSYEKNIKYMNVREIAQSLTCSLFQTVKSYLLLEKQNIIVRCLYCNQDEFHFLFFFTSFLFFLCYFSFASS
jgi:hypothetical protein